MRRAFVGCLVGAVTGAIAALNVMIYAGTDRGYEASIPEVFRESPVAGVLVVALIVGGPVFGVVVALRGRRGRPG